MKTSYIKMQIFIKQRGTCWNRWTEWNGKSTLIKLCTGQLLPDDGRVTWQSKQVSVI